MEHKAFVFNCEGFERELKGILEEELHTDSYLRLREFILKNIDHIKDPYEGNILDEDWELMIENDDPHQYGDFALTKYYEPLDDIGIGMNWEKLQDIVGGLAIEGESPILGTTVGSSDNPFDPGKMGAYFQSLSKVKQNLKFLNELKKEGADRDIEVELKTSIKMLKAANEAKKGLYVTF